MKALHRSHIFIQIYLYFAKNHLISRVSPKITQFNVFRFVKSGSGEISSNIFLSPPNCLMYPWVFFSNRGDRERWYFNFLKHPSDANKLKNLAYHDQDTTFLCEYDVFVRHFQMKYLFIYDIILKNIIFAKDWKRRQLQFRGPKKTLAPKKNFWTFYTKNRCFREFRPECSAARSAVRSEGLLSGAT